VRVLLGVTGGIAAFKAAELVRRLREDGHEVRCAMSRAAVSFVTPLTLEVLSGKPVWQEEYLSPQGTGEEAHIVAAQWAEAMVIAPATAHTLARLALGLADDFLSTTALAFRGPLLLAPAMHATMWAQPAVQGNVATLGARGVRFIGPVDGPLASGETGLGRMAEPEAIAAEIAALAASGPWAGRRVLVSAGPTHEPLDPVRFLGNRSSGKMGFAIAEQAARRGARVVLVAGPVSLPTPPGVERLDVTTAAEMEAALQRHAGEADLVVMTAAVADFRPKVAAARKIKRGDGVPTIELEANPDLLAGLARTARHAVLVGFAAETDAMERNARAKLEQKGVDFLVANDVSRGDIGFTSDANEVTVFRREGAPLPLSRRPKSRLAADLLDLFAPVLDARAAVPHPTAR
jgi:phosphopantothenoylcysteine decarboxylase/phosphopantothenate--cysteine ligase